MLICYSSYRKPIQGQCQLGRERAILSGILMGKYGEEVKEIFKLLREEKEEGNASTHVRGTANKKRGFK